MEHSSKKRIYNDLAISTVLLMVSLAINVTTVLRVVNRPIETVVIHKADNAVELHGKITGKEMVGKLYTLDCGAYGKFLVSKEQYDSVQVGDDIPSYLRGGDNDSNFRAWSKQERRLILSEDILAIDYENEEIDAQKSILKMDCRLKGIYIPMVLTIPR